MVITCLRILLLFKLLTVHWLLLLKFLNNIEGRIVRTNRTDSSFDVTKRKIIQQLR